MKTVLIAEDDQKSRYLLKILLIRNGFKILTAEDGLQAFEILKSNSTDLIISDILMPNMNGYLLCEKVKNNNKYRHIPFIFYTATFVTDKDRELALKLGADRFLIKPEEPKILLKIINEILNDYADCKSGKPDSEYDCNVPLKDLYNYSITKKLDKKVRELNENQLILKRSEQKLKEAQEIANVGHWEMDLKNNKMFWSEQMYRVLGLKPFDLEADYNVLLSLINNDERENVRKLFQELLKNRKPFDVIHSINLNGSCIKHIHQRGQVQYDEEGLPVYLIGTVHDITNNILAEKENKKKDAIIYQAQKLKSLGEMAAGIIHEIKQPLAGMTMAADLAMENLDNVNFTKEGVRKKLKIIKDCIIKINDISNRIRMFSRIQKKTDNEQFSINSCVNNIIQIIGKILYKNNISIETQLADDIPPATGSRNYFEQVILNLINNAQDSIIEKNDENTKRIIIKTFMEDKKTFITIEDNGTGIKKEIHEKIFEPFFTTKNEKDGTGLGLSVSYGIIINMGGNINVESDYGENTKFIITLPIK